MQKGGGGFPWPYAGGWGSEFLQNPMQRKVGIRFAKIEQDLWSAYFCSFMFVILLDVTVVWTELPQIMTLVLFF